MRKLVLCALGLTAITVIIHGVGALASGRRVVGRWTGHKDRPGWLGAELLMTQLVGALLLLHLAEAVVWALFYVLVGALPDLETAAPTSRSRATPPSATATWCFPRHGACSARSRRRWAS